MSVSSRLKIELEKLQLEKKIDKEKRNKKKVKQVDEYQIEQYKLEEQRKAEKIEKIKKQIKEDINMSSGGLVTKKYVNPVTIVDNIKKKK